MANVGDPRFIVVLGPARSGTTVLRDLIACHPAIAAVPFDVNHIWRMGNEGQADDCLSPDSLTPAQRAAIRARLIRLARRDSRPGADLRFVAEKTVGNALRPDFVDAVLPGALFVRIVRDPRNTIASTIQAWKAPPKPGYLLRKARMFDIGDLRYALWFAGNALKGRFGYDRGLKVWGIRYPGIQADLATESLETVCARQWVQSMEATDHFFSRLPAERGVSLTYEARISDPSVLAGIWSRLGIADADLAASVLGTQIRPARTRAGSLSEGIEAATLEAVHARMAALGYG